MTVSAAIRVAALAVAVSWLPEAQPQPAPGGAPFVVIVNKANPVRTLPLLELRRLFMKQTRMWAHAESVVPVDWDATSPNREAFSKLVLARTVREMGDYWVQQGITAGLTPPSTQRSSRAILRFVASVAGAIAYVPPADVDDTVAVVKITGLQ